MSVGLARERETSITVSVRRCSMGWELGMITPSSPYDGTTAFLKGMRSEGEHWTTMMAGSLAAARKRMFPCACS